MSIFGSIHLGDKSLDAVPERDYYDGTALAESSSSCLVDVANSPTYHSCVRLSINWPDASAEVLLTVDEVRELVKRLRIAVGDEEGTWSPR